MGSAKLQVAIVMGSDSDFSTMQEAGKILSEFEVGHEFFLTSAHRSPQRTESYATQLKSRGIQVVIVGAGMAAHLAGVIAANCQLPVIGVPLSASSLNGFDALLSTVQMPGGIPVATMAIGKAGAKNAGLLAVRILALQDSRLSEKLAEFIDRMALDVAEKQKTLTSNTRE